MKVELYFYRKEDIYFHNFLWTGFDNLLHDWRLYDTLSFGIYLNPGDSLTKLSPQLSFEHNFVGMLFHSVHSLKHLLTKSISIIPHKYVYYNIRCYPSSHCPITETMYYRCYYYILFEVVTFVCTLFDVTIPIFLCK